MSNTGQAWVTLVTNDSYALGALVLAQSLKRNNTIHQLAVLITPGVSPAMRDVLSSVFDLVKEVDVLDSKDAANLALLARPDLGITFTKLHCWKLTQYSKCVFLDADTLVIKNCDELFERDEISAAPDAGWPDCFNSGVFVFTPSENTFKSLLDFALTQGSFDGGDQGLLNMYFGDWATKDITKHLPFIYNMVATATYSYLPAFKAFGGNVKIAHFIGSSKPWLQALPGGTTLSSFLDLWWDIFLKDVSKKLKTDMGGLAGALAGRQKDVIEDQWRRQSWEQGNIDYMGRDAFENIWKKISETVEDIKPPETPAPEVSSAQAESAPVREPEDPKTDDKTDSTEVETQQVSDQPVETPLPTVEQPQPELPKAEAAAASERVSPPELVASEEAPPAEMKKEEAPTAESSEPSVPPAEVALAPQIVEAKPEDKSETLVLTAAPVETPVASALAPEPPVSAEVIPAAEPTSLTIQPEATTGEPAPSAVTETAAKVPAPPSATDSALQAETDPAPPAATDPAPQAAVPQPPTPTTEVPPSPQPQQLQQPKDSTAAIPPSADKKERSPPKDDSKPPEPPKDGGAEKVAALAQEPAAPSSPSVPSPASPSAPEGTKVDTPQSPPELQALPAAETSTPPQTPVGDAPVPPKRSSKKGKAKK